MLNRKPYFELNNFGISRQTRAVLMFCVKCRGHKEFPICRKVMSGSIFGEYFANIKMARNRIIFCSLCSLLSKADSNRIIISLSITHSQLKRQLINTRINSKLYSIIVNIIELNGQLRRRCDWTQKPR